ncbi:MAG: chemotaxis response regulator protein-glutamate methylesterase [Candidatus Tectomicrobia bacterium]|uniref:Protein-glutamate methylesterase/protein-glutamine glutaminase n=1 Tax=Tectimicrobiota bacterium TaxID=2528274 RepID=A0A932FXC8_UNCTE|nr:chemotaxis response regulator protein-glutamate methylesterase [Candidatus Tectomicrobia bacterium]
MRCAITRLLESDAMIQVIGTARDGVEALEKLELLRPDVLTLDVEMPRMDGLTTLARIMERSPTPVVMLSALTVEGAEATLRALHLGAVDFVPKPSGSLSLNIQESKEEILRKVKTAARARLTRSSPAAKEAARPASTGTKATPGRFSRRHKLIVIGSSTGGPKALHLLLPQLPADLPACVLIVQHMPAGFTRCLADGLDRISSIVVREAQAGDRLAAGLALVAPGDRHLILREGDRISLDERAPRLHGVRPAVDITLESAARLYGPAVVAVILTGMGSDGTQGAALVKAHKGHVIAEDESTCIVYGMPKQVVEGGHADEVLPLPQIVPELVRLTT